MLAKVASATLIGVQGQAISVEVHVSTGLPAFAVVGLPDASCREARDRVRAAVLSSGYRWPPHRIPRSSGPSQARQAKPGCRFRSFPGKDHFGIAGPVPENALGRSRPQQLPHLRGECFDTVTE